MPSIFETMPNSHVIHVFSLAPFCETESFFINGIPSCRTFISGLLSYCRPLAVSWFVVAIIIYSLNAQSIWAISHVFQEVGKDKPSFAHLNSSSSMLVEPLEVGIGAAPNHGSPYPVCSWELGVSPGTAMFYPFLFRAGATGYGLSPAEMGASDGFFCAALTSAEHGFDRVSGICEEWITNGYDRKFSEYFSYPFILNDRPFSGVYRGRHMADLSSYVFSVPAQLKTVLGRAYSFLKPGGGQDETTLVMRCT